MIGRSSPLPSLRDNNPESEIESIHDTGTQDLNHGKVTGTGMEINRSGIYIKAVKRFLSYKKEKKKGSTLPRNGNRIFTILTKGIGMIQFRNQSIPSIPGSTTTCRKGPFEVSPQKDSQKQSEK